MTKSTKERRKAPRVIAKLAMQIAGVGEDESVLTTESINLSAGGLQFQSKVSLPALTRLRATTLISPSISIFNVGCRLRGANPNTLEKISAWV